MCRLWWFASKHRVAAVKELHWARRQVGCFKKKEGLCAKKTFHRVRTLLLVLYIPLYAPFLLLAAPIYRAARSRKKGSARRMDGFSRSGSSAVISLALESKGAAFSHGLVNGKLVVQSALGVSRLIHTALRKCF